MSMRNRFGKMIFCLVLGLAAFGGAQMRPDEIEDLMYSMNRSKVAHQLADDHETGDDLLRKLLESGNPDNPV